MWLTNLLQISLCLAFGVHTATAECQESTIIVEKSFEIIPGQFDFETASQRCVRFGGRLARITNVAEQRAIREVLIKIDAKKRLSWIGYRKIRGTTKFADADSGAPLGIFRRFRPSVLFNKAAKGMCANVGSSAIFPNLWGEADCTSTASALCEFHRIPDEYAYFIVSSQNRINYVEAKALCARNGAEIAIFDNEDDYNPLKSSVSKSAHMLFVGYKQVRKVWVTDKGTKVTTMAADRFLPNNGQDGCAGTTRGTHKWSTYGCGSKVAYGAICKKIKAGSGHVGGKIFYYILSAGDYYSLAPRCEMDGGTVAKIESQAEQQAVVGLLARAKVNVLKLFFRSVFVTTSGHVTWSDKSALRFNNFVNKPVTGFGCINIEYTINRRGTWHTSSCVVPKSGVLCMKDPKHVPKPGIHIDIDIDVKVFTKTYILVHTKSPLSFTQWQARCKKYGGQLAIIPDAKSQATVTELMKKATFEAMIGARRSSIDRRKFIYQGGKAVQYTNWDSWNPSIWKYKSSVCLRQKLVRPGKWISCTEESLAAVCEVYRGGSLPGTTDLKPKISIVGVKKRFRVVFIDAGLTFESLAKKCKAIGGEPAVPETLAENEKARQAISASGASRALIGFRRQGNTWTSGSSSKFRNFAKGAESENQPCVEMAEHGGTWSAVACAKHRMLCQLDEFGSESTNKLPAGFEWRIKFVYVRGWTSKRWTDWATICKSKGGQLPLVLDQAESTAFTKYMKDSRLSGFVFLGGQKVGGSLKWSDGSAIRFSNFDAKYSTALKAREGCVAAQGVNGRWIFGSCTSLKTRYGVCEIRTKVQVTKLPPDPSVTNGKRFFVISDRRTLTYDDWRSKCQQMDGDLAAIENQAEQNLVKTEMRKSRVPALIAAKKSGSVFFNLGSKQLKFSNFRKGLYSGVNQCVSVLSGWYLGSWQYSSCRARSAVCESKTGNNTKTSEDKRKTFIVLANSKQLDYDSWQAQCRSRGGELAVIENLAEQDAANAIIRPLNKAVLIGPRRSKSNIKKFTTKEGRSLSFTNWQSREPNNLVETCIEMYTGGAVGKWNDIRCPHYYALCQVVGKGAPTTAKKIYRAIHALGASLKYDVWEQKCRQIGGTLAVINNAAEQKAAQDVIKSAPYSAFIAAKRLRWNSKVFVNPDSKVLTYTNWNSGEPNNLFLEPCVEMYNWGKVVGKWNDIRCSSRRAALCQLYKGTDVKQTINTKPVKEFFVLQSTKALDYDHWKSQCVARQGQLALIENAAEQQIVTSLLKAYTHAPLIALRRHYFSFVRPDGKKVGYTNWNKGEPNYLWESCVQVYTGKFGRPAGTWNDIRCKQNSALCQRIDKKIYPGYKPDTNHGAAKTRFLVLESNRKLPFATWQQQCRAKGGQLATINSATDQKAMEAALKTTRKRVIMVGMTRNPRNLRHFITAAGKTLSYSNWNSGEPNNRHERCIEVYNIAKVFGKWNDISCAEEAALCDVGGYKPTYSSFTCKKLEVLESNRKLSYTTWQQQCRAKGGQLATINSVTDQRAIEAVLKTTRKLVVLVGMTRNPRDLNRFITPAGKTLSYSNWNSGEPNSRNERCVEVYNVHKVFGKWNDIPCSAEAAVCEVGGQRC